MRLKDPAGPARRLVVNHDVDALLLAQSNPLKAARARLELLATRGAADGSRRLAGRRGVR